MHLAMVSSGADGAEQAAMRAGVKLGLKFQGWMPKFWEVRSGIARLGPGLGLREWPTYDMIARTHANIMLTDLVVAVWQGEPIKGLQKLVRQKCSELGRPLREVDLSGTEGLVEHTRATRAALGRLAARKQAVRDTSPVWVYVLGAENANPEPWLLATLANIPVAAAAVVV